MAAASAGAIGQLAPLALAAGIVLLMPLAGSQKPRTVPDTPISETERMRNQHIEDMRSYGGGASFWQSQTRKRENQGAKQNKDLSLFPWQRPATLDALFTEHVQVAEFDTADSMLTFDTNQGQVRMNRRNAIPDTLTEDLENPSDRSRVARFDTWHEMPNWANPAQIRQANAILAADTDPNNQMRRHYGTNLFNRAPGQSFRYSPTQA